MQIPAGIGPVSGRPASPVAGAAAVEKPAAPLPRTHDVEKPAAGVGVSEVAHLERKPIHDGERKDALTLGGAAVAGGSGAADA